MRDFGLYNLTLPAFRATCAAPMPPVEIAGLQPRMACSAKLLTEMAQGLLQAARLTAGQQRARVAAFNGDRAGPSTVLLPLSAGTQYPGPALLSSGPLNAAAACWGISRFFFFLFSSFFRFHMVHAYMYRIRFCRVVRNQLYLGTAIAT